MRYELTDYGFRWGAAEVTRVASGKRLGVVLTVKGREGKELEVRVTPKGYIVTRWVGDGA